MSARIEIFERQFLAALPDAKEIALASFTGSAAAFAAVSLARHPVNNDAPFVLAITPGLPEADVLLDDLQVLERECDIRALEFPPQLDGDAAATAARLKTAAAISVYSERRYPLIVVAPYPALLTGVPNAARIAAATVRLDVSNPQNTLPFPTIIERLLAAGYERTNEVDAPGLFSVRGDVLDVWEPGRERPVRAEFFGDEIEALRQFNPATQISVGKIAAVDIGPVNLPDDTHNDLLDVLPDGATVLWIDHNAYRTRRSERVTRNIYTGDPAPDGATASPFITAPLPGFAELGANVARNPELLEAARSRLRQHLAAAKRNGAKVLTDDELSMGFETPAMVIVAKCDRVFAHRHRSRRAAEGHVAGRRLDSGFDLEPGELVVHVDYGVGRFCGSTEVEVGGQRSEVFTIEYADGKLHVPVEHAHLLSRYVGVHGVEAKLYKLDGKRWHANREDAEKAVKDLAAALLNTQARRALTPGFACQVDSEEINAFEAAFPYEETDDQLAAIAEVKHDMASPKPMDRLICGDAGYGKTEVAMRAAFIAAMNGKQTVLLAPTTVLAEQHYETFLARFDSTAVRIEAMSRFQNDAARRATCERLAAGTTDIVIGTHAVLSSKIKFHDLGLVIIDEEQRFGVRHKEQLKLLRLTADVLTMSATPIPRTLYMAMTGARDLSLLRTPPHERVAVETKIERDTDAVITTAIEREISRGGQIYFLHNRVATLSRIERRLHQLIPSAKIIVAHGQMPSEQLAERMRKFSQGAADILLSTTIVESGLDITRANTILIDRADTFGIAELYQLRGRVGRGARQGYAYFLVPSEALMDSDSRERLDALRKHSGLGAGFNLALRDLELRGAGNLLGKEQSGHIAAVGFQLYCQLLQRTMAQMKGEEVASIIEVTLSLDFLDFSPGSDGATPNAAALPYDYVEDEAQRMDFHKRLAEANSRKRVNALRTELADRYGRLPEATCRLIRLAELRVECAAHGFSRIDVHSNRAAFWRAGERDPAFSERLPSASPDSLISHLFKIVKAKSA